MCKFRLKELDGEKQDLKDIKPAETKPKDTKEKTDEEESAMEVDQEEGASENWNPVEKGEGGNYTKSVDERENIGEDEFDESMDVDEEEDEEEGKLIIDEEDGGGEKEGEIKGEAGDGGQGQGVSFEINEDFEDLDIITEMIKDTRKDAGSVVEENVETVVEKIGKKNKS